jgi:hypothetical protein
VPSNRLDSQDKDRRAGASESLVCDQQERCIIRGVYRLKPAVTEVEAGARVDAKPIPPRYRDFSSKGSDRLSLDCVGLQKPWHLPDCGPPLTEQGKFRTRMGFVGFLFCQELCTIHHFQLKERCCLTSWSSKKSINVSLPPAAKGRAIYHTLKASD